MKSEFEIIEEYIDYFNDRNFVNGLSISEQVLYKCVIRDTLSFKFYMLHTRIGEFSNKFINLSKRKGERE